MGVKINKPLIDFIKTAYKALKDEKSERACFYQYKGDIGDNNKVIDYLMIKQCWYHGKWTVFEGNWFACTVDESFIKSLIKEEKSNPNCHAHAGKT